MSQDNIEEAVRYLVCSAYPDGSFRGLEKCPPWLHETPEQAELCIEEQGPPNERVHYRVVPVVVITPAVRKPLDTLRVEYPYLFPEGETP